MPTDLTVPKTLVLLPVGVISACRPFFSEARSALPTEAFTSQEPVEITTMDPEPAGDAEPLCAPPPPAEAPPAEPVLVAPEPAPDPTVSPTLSPTEATVPLMGERSVPSARDVLGVGQLALRGGDLCGG